MKIVKYILVFLGCMIQCYAQVGINTTVPSNAAVLDLNSNISGSIYGGFLPPRVTVAQRSLIPVTASDDGLLAFVTGFPTGERCLQMYDGVNSVWQSIYCFGMTTTVFLETMGSTTSNLTVSAYQTALGFTNSSTCTFTSTSSSEAKLNSVAPVSTSTYPTASGVAYLSLIAANRNFNITGMNLSTQPNNMTLSFLIYKSTTTGTGSELSIDYQINGTTWVPIIVAGTNFLPTGLGTDVWSNYVLSTSIPNNITGFRISRVTGTTATEYRIDDIRITKP